MTFIQYLKLNESPVSGNYQHIWAIINQMAEMLEQGQEVRDLEERAIQAFQALEDQSKLDCMQKTKERSRKAEAIAAKSRDNKDNFHKYAVMSHVYGVMYDRMQRMLH